MGNGQSESVKPEQSDDVANFIIKKQIRQKYSVELPQNIFNLYKAGKIQRIDPFIKVYKTMTQYGYKFSEITIENDVEISVWVGPNGEIEKRGWRLIKSL